MDNDGSRRLSVREFQVIGPATEKARRPYVDLLYSVERRLDDVWHSGSIDYTSGDIRDLLAEVGSDRYRGTE